MTTEIPADRLATPAAPAPGRSAHAPWPSPPAVPAIGWVEEVPNPAAAIARARSVADAQGGVLLVTGSHYPPA